MKNNYNQGVVVAIVEILFVLTTTFLFSACTKTFLDRKPSNYNNEQNAYKDLKSIQVALAGCYDGLQDYRYYGRNFILISEVLSGNAKLASDNTSNFSAYYNYSITSYEAEIEGFWEVGYQIISRTNKVVDALNKFPSSVECNQIKGEALALRALVYYDLIRTFSQSYGVTNGVDSADGNGGHAGIPLVLEKTNVDSLISPKRAKVREVYSQIIEDLKRADSLLIDNPSMPYTFGSLAVKALLSRVFLSTKNWSKALEYSKAVMLSGKYKLLENEEYKDSWSKEYTSESILSVPNSLTDNTGTNSIGFMLLKVGYGDSVASNDLYILFKADDVRKNFYQKGKDIFVCKYPGRLTPGLDNIPILRYSEMYLTRAEALTELSLNSSNKMLLQGTVRLLMDTLRQRANPNEIPIKASDIDLLNIIIRERRMEFAFEGQQFFDMKRRCSDIIREDCNASICSIVFPNKLFAMPIPESEVNANKNMKQNPGY